MPEALSPATVVHCATTCGRIWNWCLPSCPMPGFSAGPLSGAEHLMVWMRTAALPSFRKLWGRIEADVPAGTRFSVHIQNRYNTYRFGGQKRVRDNHS